MPYIENADFAAHAAGYQRRRRDAMCDVSGSTTASAASALVSGSDHARLGIVFMFSNIQVDPKIASVVLDSGLKIPSGLQKIDINTGGPIQTLSNGKIFCDQVSGKDLTSLTKPVMKDVVDSIEKANHKHKAKMEESGWDPMTTNMMEAYIHNMVSQISEKVRKTFKSEKFYAGAINQIVKAVLSQFYKEAVTCVTGGISAVVSTGKALKGIFQQISLWIKKHRGKFTLRPGHPSEAVNAITWGMTTSNFVGLYDAIKRGVMFAGNVATLGISKIIDVFTSFAELTMKFFWRIYEASVFRDFITWCKEAWQVRNNPNAPHTQPHLFSEMLNQATYMCPEIGALILRSGCCGNKTQWIDCYVFGNERHLISQKNFNDGASYLEKLKGPAFTLLQDCGLCISATHPTAKAYLSHATRDLTQPSQSIMSSDGKRKWVAQKRSWGRKVLSFFWTASTT